MSNKYRWYVYADHEYQVKTVCVCRPWVPRTEYMCMPTLSTKYRLYVYVCRPLVSSTDCMCMQTMSTNYRLYLYADHEYQVQTVCVCRPRVPSKDCLCMQTMSTKYRLYVYADREYQVQTVCVCRPCLSCVEYQLKLNFKFHHSLLSTHCFQLKKTSWHGKFSRKVVTTQNGNS